MENEAHTSRLRSPQRNCRSHNDAIYKHDSKIHSLDSKTDNFDIVAGMLQWDTLHPYLFIICRDYVLRMSIDLNSSKLAKERSRTYLHKPIMDVDYADDIARLANTPPKLKSCYIAAIVLILLYGCIIWTLNKCIEKKLDGNYARMLRAILNNSYRQHPQNSSRTVTYNPSQKLSKLD